MLVYLNGLFVPREEAKVSVFDHGYLYGDGIYETLRAYDGTLFLLDQHLARLRRSADAISLMLPLALDRIGDALRESLRVNGLSDAYVRIQSPGARERSGSIPRSARSQRWWFMKAGRLRATTAELTALAAG